MGQIVIMCTRES
uniref:Uncharacterized protein n=1 Tax=Rhizophora mucronata TaxID=61149 RepID=A0A2P2IT32_RHIMU